MLKSIRLQLLVTLIAVLATIGLLIHKGPPPKDHMVIAAAGGDVLQLERALRWGADINCNQPVFWDMPLLHIAAGSEDGMVELLLAHGADIALKDRQGRTPLQYALKNGYTPVAKLLVAHGAPVNITDLNGESPLHLAAAEADKELVGMILTRGAKVNLKNNAGETPLALAFTSPATEQVRCDIMAILIAHGADVNLRCKHHGLADVTLLEAALGDDRREIAKLLITHGADLRVEDSGGYLPLHRAVITNDRELVEWLIVHGADINAESGTGFSDYRPGTALHHAVHNGNLEMVMLLVSHAADVNACAAGGLTPLDWAIIENRDEIVYYLQLNGAKRGDAAR